MSALVPAAGDAQADLAGWYERSLRPRLRLAVSRGEADPRQAEELERLLGQLLHAQPARERKLNAAPPSTARAAGPHAETSPPRRVRGGERSRAEPRLH